MSVKLWWKSAGDDDYSDDNDHKEVIILNINIKIISNILIKIMWKLTFSYPSLQRGRCEQVPFAASSEIVSQILSSG